MLEVLGKDLQLDDDFIFDVEYIVEFSSLQNLQNAPRNAIIDVFGEEEKLKGTQDFIKNSIHLLHGT